MQLAFLRTACLRTIVGLAASSLALAQVAAQAAAPVCPDPATVQAARVVEFQTMMMGVSVRCKHVGVVISDHLDEMTSARRTMLTSANDRVATFLRSLGSTPKPTVASLSAPLAGPPASAAPAPAKAGKAPPAKAGAAGRAAAAKPVGPGPAAVSMAPAAATAKAATGRKPAAKALAASAAAPAPAAKAAAKPAKVSRRTDPFDRYLTMIGNQYGAGMTTLQRCKAFDAIVVSLADRTNTDRLLTMVSSSLVDVTLLEAIVNCPPKK